MSQSPQVTESPLYCNASTMNQFLSGLLRTSQWAHTIRSGPNYVWYSTGSGAHPAPYSTGTGILSPGVKRPGREDYSPPSRAEVKNERDYTSTRNLKEVLYWGPWRMCKGRLWRRASLSTGAPLDNLEGGSYTEDFER